MTQTVTQEEFYIWLEDCPVQYYYTTEDLDTVTYRFVLPDVNIEDDE